MSPARAVARRLKVCICPVCTNMFLKHKSVEKDEFLRDQREENQVPVRKIKYAPVTLSERNGIRYLHFGTPWIQGAMRMRKPDWIELEYARQMMAWMLFNEQPQHIVQLGLGAATLTKFCYRNFPTARVTAVELNPAVIAVCDTMFHLPRRDERLSVLEMDAMDYVCDSGNFNAIDVFQTDLYDATARGPVLDTPEFYSACANCLVPDGMMTVNLFGDHPSYEKNLKAMRFAFDEVICLPDVDNGNVVALAFKKAPVLDFGALEEVAARIEEATKLAAATWVPALKFSQSR